MLKKAFSLFFILNTLVFIHHSAYASRIKDLVTIKGVRENTLIGYGLVIGLNGTGDSGGEITQSALKRMFLKLGLNPQSEVNSKNVASVIVTASLPPFARTGQKIDITVSSIGDASSIGGGTLLITPLRGGDNQVYAVASGPVSLGGGAIAAKFGTGGRITNGAIVEKEINNEFDQKNSLRLAINQPDFTTAYRIQNTINTELGGLFAKARDSSTIDVLVPPLYQRKVVELVALIENYQVTTDLKAKIIINEKTGTVVAGGDVALKEVALAHGSLMVEVKNNNDDGEGGGKGQKQRIFSLPGTTTLSDLVKGLNTIGTTPEDMVSIFQALKKNGALIGDLEFI